jgi:hypothetical protein
MIASPWGGGAGVRVLTARDTDGDLSASWFFLRGGPVGMTTGRYRRRFVVPSSRVDETEHPD